MKIKVFLTVGTQLPFDRLVKLVDDVSSEFNYISFFGQIASTDYVPKNFDFRDFLDLEEYAKRFSEADLIVGHAGMGTIINCLGKNKPFAMMSRRSDLGEHRNDHQLATFLKFSELKGCFGFVNKKELISILSNIGRLEHGKISDSNIQFSEDLYKIMYQ